MPIPSDIRLRPGQIVMVEFGPDPRDVVAPGVLVGPLGVLPEMFKERPCIVITTTSGLITIVPFSTQKPDVKRRFHYCIPAGKYAGMSTTKDSWIKADLVTTVSNDRVDRPFVAGRRSSVFIDANDLKAARTALLNALQLGHLTRHL